VKIIHQRFPHRIVQDVESCHTKIIGTPERSIEESFLPKIGSNAAAPSRLVAERFPGSNKIRQRRAGESLDEQVNVVGHQAVGVDWIPTLESEDSENVYTFERPVLILEDRRSRKGSDGDRKDQAGIAVDGLIETDSLAPRWAACGGLAGR
jgi:hypothetical protein